MEFLSNHFKYLYSLTSNLRLPASGNGDSGYHRPQTSFVLDQDTWDSGINHEPEDVFEASFLEL